MCLNVFGEKRKRFTSRVKSNHKICTSGLRSVWFKSNIKFGAERLTQSIGYVAVLRIASEHFFCENTL